MARVRGRGVPTTVEEVTPADALQFEREGWPSWRLRWSWWSGGHVPQGLRYSGEPDPRRLLSGMDPAEHRAEVEAWEASRLAWLRSKGDG